MNFFKIMLAVGYAILVAGLSLFVIRKLNDRKYKQIKFHMVEKPPTPEDKKPLVENIKGSYINGFRFIPKEKTHKGLIVTFGGSEGSPSYVEGENFAENGYEVLSLFFFGQDNQKKVLEKVPLDFFQEVLDYIRKNIRDREPLTVFAPSKGAELALNLATIYQEINNLILMSPSAWTFMAHKFGDKKMASSWTYKKKELPFLDVENAGKAAARKFYLSLMLNRPIDYRILYESAEKRDENIEEKRIKVENTKANILIFAGDDDRVWQSEVSANLIKEKRQENTEVHIYHGVGHVFSLDRIVYSPSGTMILGGSLEKNLKAKEDSDRIIMERLNEWHK